MARYFGESVGFYFAFQQFYTQMLCIPAALGLGLFLLQCRSKELDHPAAPLFALCMALWAAALLVLWRRRRQLLAHRWGVENFEADERQRPGFRSRLRQSEVTGELKAVNTHSFGQRLVLQGVTKTLMLGFVGAVLVGMMYMFGYRCVSVCCNDCLAQT